MSTRAFTPLLLLDRHRQGAAWPNVAQSRLFDQFAPSVVIGYTRGHAHPTAPGALSPGRSLHHALVPLLLPSCQMIVSPSLLPLASHLQQLIPKHILVLLGFVGVQLAIGFGIGLGVWISRIRDERIGMEDRRLWFPVNWRYHSGTLMTVQTQTALSRDFDQLRGGAGGGGQGDMAGTERDTAHRPVDTGALVFAPGSKILPVLVHVPIVLTGAALCLCPADAMGASHVVAVVTLQAFVVVAGSPLVTVLVELSRTHLTAATAVRDRADPRGTGRGAHGTLTHHRTHSRHPAHC